MYDTGAVLTLHKQKVRLQLLLRVLAIDLSYSKLLLVFDRSRRAYIISPPSCAILLSEYTATLIITGYELVFVD